MFDEIDRVYYEQRAREERRRANASSDRSAMRTHIEMAAEYERRALESVPESSQSEAAKA